jgi:hypothetical protein
MGRLLSRYLVIGVPLLAIPGTASIAYGQGAPNQPVTPPVEYRLKAEPWPLRESALDQVNDPTTGLTNAGCSGAAPYRGSVPCRSTTIGNTHDQSQNVALC